MVGELFTTNTMLQVKGSRVLNPDIGLKLTSVEEQVVANSAWTSMRRTMVNL